MLFPPSVSWRILCQCDDITTFSFVFLLFFCSALFCYFCGTLLHHWPTIHWFFHILLIAVVHCASWLCCVDRHDLIAYMNVSNVWCILMLLKHNPTGAYPMIVHCLGFICSIYTSILDEGYVLTWCLNPIDAFCVCPALRLITETFCLSEHKYSYSLYYLDLKPEWIHFPALIQLIPTLSTAGSASQSQSSQALGHTCSHT